MDSVFKFLDRMDADNECEVLMIEDKGDKWYKLKDVCRYFGITNHKRWAKRFDADEKCTMNFVDTRGLTSSATFINESGVYEMLLTMDLKKVRTSGLSAEDLYYLGERVKMVERFREWLFTEVLPCIRKYGVYPQPTKAQLIQDALDRLNKANNQCHKNFIEAIESEDLESANKWMEEIKLLKFSYTKEQHDRIFFGNTSPKIGSGSTKTVSVVQTSREV